MLVVTTQAFAQESDTAVFRVGELVVQATRPVTTTGGAAAIEVRVDSLRLRPAPTLEQLMRSLPLVQVRTNSRGEAQFSLRGSGSDARQVAVLVDGLPLNLGWDDRADLSVLPTTAAHTITLARGLPSLLYGPNVLGGVVEIGVAKGASALLNPRGIRAETGFDHTGGKAFAAAATLPHETDKGNLLLRVGAGHRDRDEVALAGDVSEPAPFADVDGRLNTDMKHTDAFAALRYESNSGFWTAVTATGFTAERGIPAELHISGARFWRYPLVRRGLGIISAGTGEGNSPLGGRGDVEISFGIDAARTEIDQYTSRTYETINNQEDGDDRNYTLRLRADQTVGGKSQIHTAFTFADINHDEFLNPGINSTYRQRLWSLGSELSLSLAKGRFSMGAAYDGSDTPESGDKPSLDALHEWGARAGITSFVANDKVLVHAGLSRRARFPALRELYSGALGRFEPNPALKPEALVAAEAGGTVKLGRGEIQTVAFHHMLSDAIVRISVPDKKFKRVNRDKQVTTGVEMLASMLFERVGVGADLTLQRTRLEDETTGEEVEPEYQPGVLAGLTLTIALPAGIRLDTRARYTSGQSCVNSETGARDALLASRYVDGEISKGWRSSGRTRATFEVSAGVDNLGDATIYDQCGLPQPGRSFRVQLRIR